MAIAAVAEDLQVMAHRMKTHRAAGVVLQILKLVRNEFDDLAASQTDHVFVMLMTIDVLKVCAVWPVKNFTQNSDFTQQHETAVDGGFRRLRADFSHLHKE